MRLLTLLMALVLALLPMIARADPADIDAAARGVVRVVLIGTDGQEVFPVSHGSGFAVTPTMIVTNAHVIREALHDDTLRIGIVPSEGDEAAYAKPISVSPRNDLALLQITGGSLRFPPLTISGGVSGDMGEVSAVGYPMNVDRAQGLDISDIFRAQPPVKSRGFLSGERPSRQFDSILHTAPIARGNSGGPLLDGCGRVIGVNSFGADSEAGDAEFYFAVSTRELLPFLRENGIDAQVNSLPCRSIEDLDAAERARVVQQRAEARERLALREAELRDKRARAQLEAQVAVQDERESMVALALVLIMLAGASGIYAMQLRQKGETDQRFKIAVAVSAAALLGAIAVWLTRPGLSEIDERVAAAMDGEQGLVGQSVAQASESNLLCTLVPERSRVTGAKTDDVEFDWQDDGCVNTRTQYGYANGEWSRVFVPDDEDAISVNVFDPQTQTFRTDRYPLGRAAMAKARDARAEYSPPMCGADIAAQELGAQQQGVLSMLPTRPNERLVYSCAPHVRTGGAGSGE